MTLVGKFSTCSICGKYKLIASERNKVWEKQSRIDIYLECEDCGKIPLLGNIKKNKMFENFRI